MRAARCRIDQHAQRRDAIVVAVEAPQRILHRRPQVRAAADRLGEKDVGTRVAGQPLGGVGQRREAAAEAAAGDLLDRIAPGRDDRVSTRP